MPDTHLSQLGSKKHHLKFIKTMSTPSQMNVKDPFFLCMLPQIIDTHNKEKCYSWWLDKAKAVALESASMCCCYKQCSSDGKTKKT